MVVHILDVQERATVAIVYNIIGSIVNYHGPHFQKNGRYDDPDMHPALTHMIVASALMHEFLIVNCDGNCSSDKAIQTVREIIGQQGHALEVHDMSTRTPTHFRDGKDGTVTGENFDHCYIVCKHGLVKSVNSDGHELVFKMRDLCKWSDEN